MRCSSALYQCGANIKIYLYIWIFNDKCIHSSKYSLSFRANNIFGHYFIKLFELLHCKYSNILNIYKQIYSISKYLLDFRVINEYIIYIVISMCNCEVLFIYLNLLHFPQDRTHMTSSCLVIIYEFSEHKLKPKLIDQLKHLIINKPAAQAAGADPSRCNSTTR